MGRMDTVLRAMRTRGEKILVSYFPLGDSCVADSAEWAKRFFENGTTVLELGLPYENPVLDGAVIRESMVRALARIDLEDAFREIAAIRAACPQGILQVMTYVENILKYGYEDFADRCAACGADAVLAANADPEQMALLDRALQPRGIDNLRFVPYFMSDDIVRDLQRNAGGYVYLQAVNGATGSQADITPQVGENIKTLRAAGVTVPLIPGFGISTPEDVKTYLSMGADGAIVGSAIVKHILAGDGERYIKSLSEAMK